MAIHIGRREFLVTLRLGVPTPLNRALMALLHTISDAAER